MILEHMDESLVLLCRLLGLPLQLYTLSEFTGFGSSPNSASGILLLPGPEVKKFRLVGERYVSLCSLRRGLVTFRKKRNR